jgi:hypothetical protein
VIVMGNEFANGGAKMALVDWDDEIQTLAPDRSNNPFAKAFAVGVRTGVLSADTEIFQSQIDRLREDASQSWITNRYR